MPNANSFPDGQRGRTRSNDVGRVADYSASTLPVRGPGVVGRRFPSGTVVRTLAQRARGGNPVATIPPLTVVDASDDAHPGRVRVYKGRLGGKLPTNMNLVDALLPGGADNRCYLTLASGFNFVYGKVLVDAATGIFLSAVVYVVDEAEDLDGTYAYLPIAEVSFDDTGVHISDQLVTGNQKLKAYTSPDGSIITADWDLQT